MNGILNIHKPGGKTSYAMVAMVKRLTGEKRVGHAGTLDPMATGVLPVCLGQATRLVEYLMSATKTYLAEIEFGISTDTYDREGKVTHRGDYASVTLPRIRKALKSFIGEIQQRPPVYSALKYQGKPLYEMARAGIAVPVKSRKVHIENIDIKDWHKPILTLEITCGKGTYIRSLAHDLGNALDCGASLRNLIRKRVGKFEYAAAITPEQLQEACRTGYWENLLYPMDSIIEDWQAVVLSDATAREVAHGTPVALRIDQRQGYARAYTTGGDLLGVMRYDGKKRHWQPEKIFLSLTPPDLCGTNNSRACCPNCGDNCSRVLTERTGN